MPGLLVKRHFNRSEKEETKKKEKLNPSYTMMMSNGTF